MFALDPTRSTGVPLNAQFRNPTPGALEPQSYDDPVTIPAADIADNPYWKRDTRRNYPQLSVFKQGDVAGLLTFGNKEVPKEDVLQVGEAGEKQLIAAKQEGEERGLAAHFEKDKSSIKAILGPDGLPPLPAKLNKSSAYELSSNQAYPEKYVYPSSFICPFSLLSNMMFPDIRAVHLSSFSGEVS